MRTIVVASDAPSVRAEVIAVVGEPDTTVVEVSSGTEVAPTVAEHDPDLVVVDLQMGNMGGMAVCLELRLAETMEDHRAYLPHVPVLMLLDRRPDVFMARRSGAEGWLVKPLDPIRLRRATAALLDGGVYHDDSYLPMPVLQPPSPATGTATAVSGQPAADGATG